ncbi:MAG: nucleotidyltransferase family protein [Bacillota bacterium]|nr:nucleotidyltransferase family protein [Bacillota bacterium]
MEIKQLFIYEQTTIRETIKKLDETAKRILFVVSDNDVLEGVVTDGDIRRWILKNGDFESSVVEVMTKNPHYIQSGTRKEAFNKLMELQILAIPIVDELMRIVDVVFWNEMIEKNSIVQENLSAPLVIMAGGKGTRLKPYTNVLPKPLIPIGDIPISERIIKRFSEYGVKKFFLTVNYKKNMIKAYFADEEFDYDVEFVEENQPLGTAGGLSLLKGKINEAFFVSNCDILINGDYVNMMRFHKENKAKITLISSLKNYEVSYGVIQLGDDNNLIEMLEKPEYSFLVNTGMYILEPEVIDDIPENTHYHMTDLINQYVETGEKVAIYPIRETDWLDMGQIKEMEIMLERLDVL